MKRFMASIVCGAMTMGLLTGCTSETAEVATEAVVEDTLEDTLEEVTDAEPLKIVATIFPEYEWVREILGEQLENTELTLLLNDGVDLHSYQVTTDDMITIGASDLFIYVGGESDTWVDDVLANATNENMVVLNLLDILGDDVKSEEMVEGMQETEHDHDHDEEVEAEEEHDHDHDEEAEAEHDHDEEAEAEEEHDHDEEAEAEEEHDHDHEEETESDEHVWLSLRNAEVISYAIADALMGLDVANADLYEANVATYVESLQTLDAAYEEAVESASTNTILVADRFAFRYLVDDYNLEYYAAFIGCSAETEASFETIAFLAQKVDELNLEDVIILEGSDSKIADTVISSTEEKTQTILEMHSMQSITDADLQAGATYLSIMEKNLEVLKEALN